MKVKIPPTTSRSSRGRLSHLGALVGRVGSGVGEDESGVSAQLQRALVPVVPQSSFHPAQVHGRVDDVVVVLEPHTWGQIRLLSHRAEPLRSTYRIVLEVHGLSERLRVFTPKYVVDQVLALVLPGVPVRHGLQRGLERASTRSTASRGRRVPAPAQAFNLYLGHPVSRRRPRSFRVFFLREELALGLLALTTNEKRLLHIPRPTHLVVTIHFLHSVVYFHDVLARRITVEIKVEMPT